MRAPQRQVRRMMLRRALMWTPFVLLPFSLFFFEAWLCTRTLHNAYDANELTRELREVTARITDLKNEEAQLKRIERVSAEAPDLGLVEPSPGQVLRVSVALPRGEGQGERHDAPATVRAKRAAAGFSLAGLAEARNTPSDAQ